MRVQHLLSCNVLPFPKLIFDAARLIFSWENLWHKIELALGSPEGFERKNLTRRKCMLKIKVLLADDHIVVRQGLRALLAAE